ncbi:MAG: lipase family protein [Armatimonadota bacterium]|nr:lipase family protein [Armatimonadota bacterium]
MPFANGYDVNEAQVAMTLAALAYTNENALPGETIPHQQERIRAAIIQQLGNSDYATNNLWEFAWGPGLTSGDMMYVAKKKSADQYAVAIRGTDWSFLMDWIEDFDVLQLVAFPYISTQDANIRISKGSMDGLTTLLGMNGAVIDSQSDAGPDMSLLQFLMDAALHAPGDIDIFVTGHSLGGALASVLAAWLSYETAQWGHLPGKVNVKTYTFAAPSAGNSNFATYYDNLFGANAWRVYNKLDAVPNAWQTLNVITTYYTPQPLCPLVFKGLIDLAADFTGSDQYTQPTNARELPGEVNPAHNTNFVDQVEDQHSYDYYLQLLGAKPIDILSKVNPSAVMPTATPAGASPPPEAPSE